LSKAPETNDRWVVVGPQTGDEKVVKKVERKRMKAERRASGQFHGQTDEEALDDDSVLNQQRQFIDAKRERMRVDREKQIASGVTVMEAHTDEDLELHAADDALALRTDLCTPASRVVSSPLVVDYSFLGGVIGSMLLAQLLATTLQSLL
jgi:hypothetical protein